MKKYGNTLILFASLAFIIMWVDRFVYKQEELKYNYFFLMFSLAGFLWYTYRRGVQRMKQDAEEKQKQAAKSNKKKPDRK